MKRKLYDKLKAWKESPYRKPLIIKGARQVGKTYLAEEFGKNEYEDMIVLNCDKDKRIAGIFKGGFQTEKIISDIEILTGKKIIPGKTLLFMKRGQTDTCYHLMCLSTQLSKHPTGIFVILRLLGLVLLRMFALVFQ